MTTSLPLRILALLLVVGAPLTFSACGDKAKTSVAPAGSVRGELLPAGAVTKVIATSADGKTYEFVATSQTAAFQLDKLPAGDYTLSFLTTASYSAPAPVAVTVYAGVTTVVPTRTLQSTGQFAGEMSWTAGGQSYTAALLMGTASGESFTLNGQLLQPNGADYDEVSIRLSAANSGTPTPFSGTGIYPFGTSMGTSAWYMHKAGGTVSTYVTFRLGQPAGIVTITEWDPVARKAAGTFGFTASGWLNATGTQDITNGNFRISY